MCLVSLGKPEGSEMNGKHPLLVDAHCFNFPFPCFFILTFFCLIVVGVEGYCCV